MISFIHCTLAQVAKGQRGWGKATALLLSLLPSLSLSLTHLRVATTFYEYNSISCQGDNSAAS